MAAAVHSYEASCRSVGAQPVPVVVAALETSNPHLALDARECTLKEKDIVAIAQTLASNPHNITAISLEGHSLSPSCMEAWLSGLLRVKDLKLANCRIGDHALSVLARFLGSGSSSVRMLDLSQNSFGTEGVQALCDALQSTASDVTELSLYGNDLNHEAAAYIGAMLQRHLRLRHFHMGANSIGRGCKDIAKALQSNRVLVTLDLSSNGIGSAGGREIAHALLQNPTLSRLNLNDNQMSHDTLVMFAEVLRRCRLLQLHISSNQASLTTAEEVLAAAANAPQLEKLALLDWPVSAQAVTELIHTIQKSPQLLAIELGVPTAYRAAVDQALTERNGRRPPSQQLVVSGAVASATPHASKNHGGAQASASSSSAAAQGNGHSGGNAESISNLSNLVARLKTMDRDKSPPSSAVSQPRSITSSTTLSSRRPQPQSDEAPRSSADDGPSFGNMLTQPKPSSPPRQRRTDGGHSVASSAANSTTTSNAMVTASTTPSHARPSAAHRVDPSLEEKLMTEAKGASLAAREEVLYEKETALRSLEVQLRAREESLMTMNADTQRQAEQLRRREAQFDAVKAQLERDVAKSNAAAEALQAKEANVLALERTIQQREAVAANLLSEAETAADAVEAERRHVEEQKLVLQEERLAFDEKVEEWGARTQALRAKEDSIATKYSNLFKHSEVIAAKEEDLAQRMAQIDGKRREYEAKLTALATREAVAQQTLDEAMDKEEESYRRVETLHEREKELETNRRLAEEQRYILDAEAAQIAARSTALSNREKSVSMREREVEEHAASLQKEQTLFKEEQKRLTTERTRSSAQLKVLETTLESRHEQIDAEQAALAKRTESVMEREAALSKAEAELSADKAEWGQQMQRWRTSSEVETKKHDEASTSLQERENRVHLIESENRTARRELDLIKASLDSKAAELELKAADLQREHQAKERELSRKLRDADDREQTLLAKEADFQQRSQEMALTMQDAKRQIDDLKAELRTARDAARRDQAQATPAVDVERLTAAAKEQEAQARSQMLAAQERQGQNEKLKAELETLRHDLMSQELQIRQREKAIAAQEKSVAQQLETVTKKEANLTEIQKKLQSEVAAVTQQAQIVADKEVQLSAAKTNMSVASATPSASFPPQHQRRSSFAEALDPDFGRQPASNTAPLPDVVSRSRPNSAPSSRLAVESLLAMPVEKVLSDYPTFAAAVRGLPPDVKAQIEDNWGPRCQPNILAMVTNSLSAGLFDIPQDPSVEVRKSTLDTVLARYPKFAAAYSALKEPRKSNYANIWNTPGSRTEDERELVMFLTSCQRSGAFNVPGHEALSPGSRTPSSVSKEAKGRHSKDSSTNEPWILNIPLETVLHRYPLFASLFQSASKTSQDWMQRHWNDRPAPDKLVTTINQCTTQGAVPASPLPHQCTDAQLLIKRPYQELVDLYPSFGTRLDKMTAEQYQQFTTEWDAKSGAAMRQLNEMVQQGVFQSQR